MQERRKYVVRVVLPRSESTPHLPTAENGSIGRLLESLRYAGLVQVHRDDDDGICFDILPPRGVNSKAWSDQLAERMESFGYNAVSAPAWFTPGQKSTRREV